MSNQPSPPNPQETKNPERVSQTAQEDSSPFVDVKDLLNEFQVPKESTQVDDEQAGDAGSNSDPEKLESGANVENAPLPDFSGRAHTVVAEKPPMDESEALKQTEKVMRFRENLQAYGIAMYADGKITDIEQYKYKEHQFKQLVNAWSPVVQQTNFRLPPMADIALAEVMCTGPLLGLMNQNRKYRKQIEKLQKVNEFLEKQVEVSKKKRGDTKSLWEIGTNAKGVFGYFVRTPTGVYIKQPDRRERPEMTEENIKLIAKHNGQQAVDKMLGK